MLLNIGNLYPDLLNIYGDRGNIICLKKRCQWRGIEVKVTDVSLDYQLKAGEFDLFFGGGGQDRQQLIVAKDLQKKARVLKQEALRDVPMLTVCGTYQLFGHFFKTNTGCKIPGISIFDVYTVSSHQRKIGNIVVKLNPLIAQSLSNPVTFNHSVTQNLVGFENHIGNTFFSRHAKSDSPARWVTQDTSGTSLALPLTLPLGKVMKGCGNNGQDKTEGAIFKNVLGTYLHGPLLPKNPHLADWLIKKALEIKYKKPIALKSLDDSLEWQAHQAASKRG